MKWLYKAGGPITSSAHLSVDGKMVYLFQNATVYAVDAIAGTELWTYTAANPIAAGGLTVTAQTSPIGQTLVFVPNG